MSQFLRYQNVLAKAHAHTVRSADLENLIVAVDLRNRDAARRNIDSDLDTTLLTRKAEFAAHIITVVEAAKIHVMNPQLSEQEILATKLTKRTGAHRSTTSWPAEQCGTCGGPNW